MSASIAIEPTSTIVQSSDQVSCDLDGETVLMSIEKGMYYGMDPIASRIWELILEPHSVVDLCNTLLAEYEVEREPCEQQVHDFLQTLQEEGLIVVN